jgi:magnesium transporter
MFKCYDLVDGRVRRCPDGQLGIIQVYSDPSDEEKLYLIEQCGIDEHTLNSALDEDEISRVEYEQNHVAIIMKRPRDIELDQMMAFRVSSLGAFLFKDRIIVVQAESASLFEHGKMPLRGNSIPGVLLRLLYHATQHFLQHLRLIRNISDEIEKKIEYAVTNKSMVNVFSFQKSLTYYEYATRANLLLIGKLKDDFRRIGFQEEELDFLEDIAIENKQCDNLARIYSEILTGMSEARRTIASNNLSNIMKLLAIINIVFMPLTVITGLGGMSEFTMMTEGLWWPHAYAGLLVFMIAVGYITYLLVRDIGTPRNRRKR